MRLTPLLDVRGGGKLKKKREWETERRKRETQKGFRLVGPFTNSSCRKVGRVGKVVRGRVREV